MNAQRRIPQASPAELVVMRALWRRSPATAAEVVAALEGRADWSPKTIHTLIKRLVAKGALLQEKRGREHVFTPLVPEEEYALHASRTFLDRFFEGQLTPFLSTFLKHEKLSKREIAELKQLLENHK